MKIRNIFKIAPFILAIALVLFSFKSSEETTYKCLIQLTNYTGEGAYVVVSLINADGEYEETLNVLGDDDEWYSNLVEWWKFQGTKRADIDAVTGETISGGERSVSILKIDNSKIDAGYKIRFETSVENQEYYKDDVEFDLTSESVKSKIEGKGFIRYIRMMPK